MLLACFLLDDVLANTPLCGGGCLPEVSPLPFDLDAESSYGTPLRFLSELECGSV